MFEPLYQFLTSIFDDRPHDLRRKTRALYVFLVAANGAAWLCAFVTFGDQPALLASAVLAYTLGLRHAVDADHIAAIDNVTRKLMQEGKRPICVGFFFALGHSSIVTLMSLGVCFAAALLESHLAGLRSVGSVVGTGFSALYLFVLAFFNLVILASVWRSFAAVKRGETLRQYELDLLLNGRGVLARLFRPLFRIATRSWHMFPMGLLFGLGFDTASEVALFGISASQAAKGVSLWSIMIFPALFTAGMSLVDTADGTLMQGAYGWAFAKPIRRLFYNLTITLVSVVVAVAIAGIETLGLLREKFALQGGFWDLVGALSQHFGLLGYAIIVVFIASWLVSMAVYKLKRYDDIDVALS
jgi:high-affinity nickel-transport protein